MDGWINMCVRAFQNLTHFHVAVPIRTSPLRFFCLLSHYQTWSRLHHYLVSDDITTMNIDWQWQTFELVYDSSKMEKIWKMSTGDRLCWVHSQNITWLAGWLGVTCCHDDQEDAAVTAVDASMAWVIIWSESRWYSQPQLQIEKSGLCSF